MLILRSDYYYSFGKRVYIKHRNDLVAYQIPTKSNLTESEHALISATIQKFQIDDSNFDFTNQNILVLNRKSDSEFRTALGSEFAPKKRYQVAKNRFANVGILIDDGILLRFKKGTSIEEIKKVLNQYGPSQSSKYVKERYELNINSEQDGFKISNELYRHPLIKYAHPNLIFRVIKHNNCGDCIQTDQLQPSMNNNMHNQILGTKILHSQNIRGNSTIKIAILDDAVDYNHPYFEGRAIGPHLGNHNGHSSSSLDCHGTPVAGLAVGNSGDGLFNGTCPECSLVAVSISGSTSQFINHIEELIFEQKVAVINMSYELNCYVDGQIEVLTEDVKSGRNGNGIAVCMSVGNNLVDICNVEHLQNNDYLIAVAATNRSDKALKKNSGECVDIAAPGYGIYSPGNNFENSENILCNISLTSAASPLVAGVIGLMIGENPEITIDGIKNILKDTAKKLSNYSNGGQVSYDYNGHNQYIGYGRLDALKALVPYVSLTLNGDISTGQAHPFKLKASCVYGIEKIRINSDGYYGANPIAFTHPVYSLDYTIPGLQFESVGTKVIEVIIEDSRGLQHSFIQEVTVQ